MGNLVANISHTSAWEQTACEGQMPSIQLFSYDVNVKQMFHFHYFSIIKFLLEYIW